MNKINALGFILLCTGCILKENCYDTLADPISEYDKTFLPYTIDNVYVFKDLNTNNIVSFKCDTVYEYWQNIFMDGDCDFYAKTNIRKVILSSFFNNDQDRITISASLISSKVNRAFSYYTERNKCHTLLIDINYTNPHESSNYYYSSYIVKSSPNLSFYDTGGALADTSLAFYETKNINGRTHFRVNEIIGLNPSTSTWSDTLYINNEYGILDFNIRELNYDLVYNQ
jgi:hypothetical protein